MNLFLSAPAAKRAVKWTLFFLAYAGLIGAISEFLAIPQIGWGTEATGAFTLILGFLVAFRSNAAYNRWWEARQLWGRLVNDSRNLALKAKHYVRPVQADCQELARLLVEFARALRDHLRSSPSSINVPILLTESIFAMLGRWLRDGLTDSQTLRSIDAHVLALIEVCGGCERIRNTPLPPSPSSLLKLAFTFYLLATPAFILNEVGWWGLIPLGIGVFLLIAVESAAEAMEEPFGTTGDDLNLDGICAAIERSMHQIMLASEEKTGYLAK
jgi:putative membrane protein